MLNKISLLGSKPDNGFVTFTPRTFYANELCGWSSGYDWSSEYIDRIPYWYVGSEKISLKEVSVGTISKLSKNNIELSGVINFDLTVACLGYSVERVIKSGESLYHDRLFDDPWELNKSGKKVLMFTPPPDGYLSLCNLTVSTQYIDLNIHIYNDKGALLVSTNWSAKSIQIPVGSVITVSYSITDSGGDDPDSSIEYTTTGDISRVSGSSNKFELTGPLATIKATILPP